MFDAVLENGFWHSTVHFLFWSPRSLNLFAPVGRELSGYIKKLALSNLEVLHLMTQHDACFGVVGSAFAGVVRNSLGPEMGVFELRDGLLLVCQFGFSESVQNE